MGPPAWPYSNVKIFLCPHRNTLTIVQDHYSDRLKYHIMALRGRKTLERRKSAVQINFAVTCSCSSCFLFTDTPVSRGSRSKQRLVSRGTDTWPPFPMLPISTHSKAILLHTSFLCYWLMIEGGAPGLMCFVLGVLQRLWIHGLSCGCRFSITLF